MDNDTGTPDTQPNAEPTPLGQVLAHATNIAINALPLPTPNTPQSTAERDLNAITQVAALVPANAAEVMVAVQFVVTGAQGLECQRVAQDISPETAQPLLRMAATMFRTSQAAANTLLRLQHARNVREATPGRAATALMVEHGTLQLMTKALTRRAADAREAAEREALARAEREAPVPPAPEPEPALITPEDVVAAEVYARTNASNLNRARIMRRKRGMPDWGMFTPPEDNVVRALAFGHSPFLDALLP